MCGRLTVKFKGENSYEAMSSHMISILIKNKNDYPYVPPSKFNIR